jgi:PKD repeat protein
MKKILALFLMLIFLTYTASAAPLYTLSKCTTAQCGKFTERLSCGKSSVNYTVLPTKDPYTFQFKDLSKGKITYMRWDFGDGTHLESTKITKALRNPKKKNKKIGHYTGCLTIKCQGVKGKLWVHKDLNFNICSNPCIECKKCH